MSSAGWDMATRRRVDRAADSWAAIWRMTVRLLLLEQQYLHVHVAAVSRSRPAIRRRPPPILPTADPAHRRSCPPPILPAADPAQVGAGAA
jgi:hypothetical protein